MFNFFYCDIPKRLKISPWSFYMFAVPFDSYICDCLLITFITLLALLYLEGISPRLSFLSALFAFGTQPLSNCSGLFMLWMFVSIILVTFYSGDMTSTVISPPPEDVIKTLSELCAQNYTLHLSGYSNHAEILNRTVISLKPSSSVRKTLECLQKNVKFDLLYRLVDGYDKVLFDYKTFTAVYWRWGLYFVNEGNKRIQNVTKTKKDKARRCYVGEEYIPYDEEFFMILPSENVNLAIACRRLYQAGIVQMFVQESDGMLTFDRVQDRVRFLCKTNFNHERETRAFERLKWHGKTITIFLQWIFCTGMSCIGFAFEVVVLRPVKLSNIVVRMVMV